MAVPVAAALSSFRDYYHDVTKDEHNRAYGPLMAAFAVPTGENPATLRDLATNNPESTSVGYLILCQDPLNPAGPGYLRAIHNVARYRAALGQPATIWDNRMFGSTGDTVGTQIPATVELPGTMFQQANNGATYRVADGPLMNILFSDVNRQICGPYADHDVATELVQCRNCVPLPHRYFEHFVGGTKTPREAWETVGHALNVNGDETNCKILFDFLRLACTVNAAGDAASALAGPDLTSPVPDVALITHRTALINAKLPGLNRTPTLQASTEVVAAIGGLVTEQRATRQDALDRRLEEQTKTPDQYFGPSVQILHKLCRVPDSASLPQVYHDLAQNGKKKARLTMQLALDESAQHLAYGTLRIVLTPDVASKIDGLMWRSSHTDLGVGINPCTFGDSDPESSQVNSDVIRQYDLLNDGGASPSLQDIQSLIGKSKATLARTFVELEASTKMFHIYLHTFYGPDHPVTASWRTFVARSNNEYRSLQYYIARTPRHQFLVPALVQHWCKLKFAYYVEQQWNSYNAITVPDFEALWEKIATGEQWESPLPTQYLAPLPAQHPVPGGPSPPPQQPGPNRPSPGPTAPGGGSTSVANLNYNSTKFASFKDLGLMVRDVILRAAASGHPLPKNDRGTDMCITFHVKGFCNTNCRRSPDHSPPGPVRNPAEEARLYTWCETCYVAAA
jgi:hypothetical protein